MSSTYPLGVGGNHRSARLAAASRSGSSGSRCARRCARATGCSRSATAASPDGPDAGVPRPDHVRRAGSSRRVGDVIASSHGAIFEARSDNPRRAGAVGLRTNSAGCRRRAPTAWCGRRRTARDADRCVSVALLAVVSSCVLAACLPHSVRIDPQPCRAATMRTDRRRGWTPDPTEPSRSHPSTPAGSLKGFVVSGRWPDSTKEWAQLLMVAVRVASLPGLLSTTTIFGVREELPDEPAPGTVGLVMAEGTVVGESAIPPGYFARRQPPALLMLHPAVGDHAVAARVRGRRVGLRAAARPAAPRPRPPRGLGRGRVRRHDHVDGQPGRRRPHHAIPTPPSSPCCLPRNGRSTRHATGARDRSGVRDSSPNPAGTSHGYCQRTH